ncbi:MAG: biopolymer transporter ExbD [Phycisphaeraceae bacterium]|nr:biopolymer transporter ExbD [Phycisphaeraceae bacterium]
MSARSRHRVAALQRRDALHSYSMHFGPNMTPMVDVVMVILIFFMASAAFMGDEWFLRAAIPFEFGRGTATDRAADPLEIPPDRLEVVMETDGAGRTLVSFLEIAGGSIEQFERRVGAFPRSAETANLEVVIKAAPGVPYREVIRVHSALDRAGVVKIGVSVKQAPAPGAGTGGSPALPTP